MQKSRHCVSASHLRRVVSTYVDISLLRLHRLKAFRPQNLTPLDYHRLPTFLPPLPFLPLTLAPPPRNAPNRSSSILTSPHPSLGSFLYSYLLLGYAFYGSERGALEGWAASTAARACCFCLLVFVAYP